MATVDDLTVLREAVLNAYSSCRHLRNLVVKNDAAWLSEKISEFVGTLEDNWQAVGRLYKVALDTARQAAAIEKLPPFRLIDDELETATEGAGLLTFRYSNCFHRGDAAKIRAAIVSTPAVDFEAARKRVIEEWAAAVRLLSAIPPATSSAGRPDAAENYLEAVSSDRKGEMPSNSPWNAEAGGFWFGDKFYTLIGKPLALLHVFLDSPRRQTFGYADLEAAWVDDKLVEKDTIRAAISDLRTCLRRVARDAGIDCPDPLPGNRGAWRFALPR